MDRKSQEYFAGIDSVKKECLCEEMHGQAEARGTEPSSKGGRKFGFSLNKEFNWKFSGSGASHCHKLSHQEPGHKYRCVGQS